MAAKQKTQTLNIPSEVVDSEWRDDIDADYATREDVDLENQFAVYEKEGEYIDPSKVSKVSIKKIKSFREKIAFKNFSKFCEQELTKVA